MEAGAGVARVARVVVVVKDEVWVEGEAKAVGCVARGGAQDLGVVVVGAVLMEDRERLEFEQLRPALAPQRALQLSSGQRLKGSPNQRERRFAQHQAPKTTRLPEEQ